MAVGTKTAVNADTDSTSSRKMPHCKTCQRPRAGHPRSGCPYADCLAPAAGSSTHGSLEATESLEALHIDSFIVEKRGRRLSEKVDFIFEADVLAANTSTPAAMVASAAEKSPVPKTSVTTDDSLPARPSTPEAERSPHTSDTTKACSLNRTVSRDEQRIFFDRARLTSEGSVVILKHSMDGISDLLAGAKTVGLAAEMIGSLGKNSRLVAFGRDGELVRKVRHVGGSNKEAVDKVCENKVKKRCYSALVVGGAGAMVGAVATWMALAFL